MSKQPLLSSRRLIPLLLAALSPLAAAPPAGAIVGGVACRSPSIRFQVALLTDGTTGANGMRSSAADIRDDPRHHGSALRLRHAPTAMWANGRPAVSPSSRARPSSAAPHPGRAGQCGRLQPASFGDLPATTRRGHLARTDLGPRSQRSVDGRLSSAVSPGRGGVRHRMGLHGRQGHRRPAGALHGRSPSARRRRDLRQCVPGSESVTRTPDGVRRPRRGAWTLPGRQRGPLVAASAARTVRS